MKLYPFSRKPELQDFNSDGFVNILYSADNKALQVCHAIADHRWLTGKLLPYEIEVRAVVLFGWYPGDRSEGYKRWLEEQKEPPIIDTQVNLTPTIRRIRVDASIPDHTAAN